MFSMFQMISELGCVQCIKNLKKNWVSSKKFNDLTVILSSILNYAHILNDEKQLKFNKNE